MSCPRLLGHVNPAGLDDIAEALTNETTPPDNINLIKLSSESHDDFWRIYGVKCQNKIYSVDMQKYLLDERASKTQDGWAEYSSCAIGIRSIEIVH